MTEYRVRWEMLVSANSAREAAQEAFDAIINYGSQVFDVQDAESGEVETIDLFGE